MVATCLRAGVVGVAVAGMGASAFAGPIPPVLVDDFQAYTPGLLGGQGHWVTVDDFRADGLTEVQDAPGDPGNQVFTAPGDSGDIIYNNSPLFAAALPEGGSDTLYFEFRADTVSDFGFGLAQSADPGWEFGEFAVQVTLIGGADEGFVNLRARDGGSFTNIAVLELGQWYEVWLDVDNVASAGDQSYSVSLRGGAFTEQTEVASDFGYRNTTVGPLQSMLVHTRDAEAFINNIYIPEPASLALLGVGGLMLLRRRR